MTAYLTVIEKAERTFHKLWCGAAAGRTVDVIISAPLPSVVGSEQVRREVLSRQQSVRE